MQMIFNANPNNGQLLMRSKIPPMLESSIWNRDVFSEVHVERMHPSDLTFQTSDRVAFLLDIAGLKTHLGGPKPVRTEQEATDRARTSLTTSGLLVSSSTLVDVSPIVSGRRLFRYKNYSFVGQAVVVDPQALVRSLLLGIGRGKAWGSGLLQVRRLSDNS